MKLLRSVQFILKIVAVSLAGLVGSILVFVLWMSLKPLNLSGLNSSPKPTSTYAESIMRYEAFIVSRDEPLNSVCHSELLTHGAPTEQTVVLIHGFTNCPAQFAKLRDDFYAAGYNVLIPLVPRHGLADRMTDELANLTAEELATYADTVVDIAQGLGDEVTVVGISAGGAVAGWIAQHRADVDFAVLLAPGFGVSAVATDFQPATINSFLTLPNRFIWWDIIAQENKPGPPQIYPRYSTHAAAELMRLGLSIRNDARVMPPSAQRILVVTNENDALVNNDLTEEITALWSNNAEIETYVFPQELNVPHDMIEPLQEDEQIEVVYPILLDLILDG